MGDNTNLIETVTEDVMEVAPKNNQMLIGAGIGAAATVGGLLLWKFAIKPLSKKLGEKLVEVTADKTAETDIEEDVDDEE